MQFSNKDIQLFNEAGINVENKNYTNDEVERFKIKVTDIYPGLVGIKSEITTLKALNGLRFKCNVSVIEKRTKKCVWTQYGEVQFKGDGISGIVVMEASTFIARHQGNYIINLDLMPEASLDDTVRMLNKRKDLFENEIKRRNL